MGVFISRRALSAKERGQRGGLATARKQDKSFLQSRALNAGKSTRDNYGLGYYKYIRSLRKHKPQSAKEKVQEIISTFIPEKEPIPVSSLDIIKAAAKML